MPTKYTIDELGYSRLLFKASLFEQVEETPAATNVFTGGVAPAAIQSGDLAGNLNMIQGYLQSSNFITGVNGWKFDNAGNLEANTATIRGSIYASAGLIGGWVVDDDGLYYSGSGTPSIRTAEEVGAGADGVLIDKDGIKVYDSVLGVVVNLPSDGSAPQFASGVIENTTFEINTNAVLRTSETVGDGTANSAGVLINNSGIYACEANQLLSNANVRINNRGNAYFKGDIFSSTITASELNGVEINGSIITGGLFRTAETGQRLEINSEGIELKNGESGATYSDPTRLYGDSDYPYGNGVLGYINNSTKKVPFYINAEQTVADIHLYNRTADPTGPAEVGDLCVVNGRLKICVVAGTPGGWDVVGVQTAVSSASPSLSPSASPSLSASASPSFSPSESGSLSPSISDSASPSDSASESPSASPSESASASPSLSASESPSLSPSLSASDGPIESWSPSISPSESASISPSPSPSLSASLSPSISASLSPSLSASISSSQSPSASLSPSASPSDSYTLLDSYSTSNKDSGLLVASVQPAIGQSFEGDGGTLHSVQFYLTKIGTITGNAVAKVYAHTGTFGSGGTATGSALATSGNFDVSTLTSSYQLITFTFSGAEKITLSDGTYYVVVIEYTGGDSGNAVIIGTDNSSPTHSGNTACYVSSWSAMTRDTVFYVYKDA